MFKILKVKAFLSRNGFFVFPHVILVVFLIHSAVRWPSSHWFPVFSLRGEGPKMARRRGK